MQIKESKSWRIPNWNYLEKQKQKEWKKSGGSLQKLQNTIKKNNKKTGIARILVGKEKGTQGIFKAIMVKKIPESGERNVHPDTWDPKHP